MLPLSSGVVCNLARNLKLQRQMSFASFPAYGSGLDIYDPLGYNACRDSRIYCSNEKLNLPSTKEDSYT